MKQPITKIALTAFTAAALSLSLAGNVFATSESVVQPTMLAANDTVDQAGETVSDTWITSKVKSTLLADTALSGMDIKVETNKGVVTLTGTVATAAVITGQQNPVILFKGFWPVNALDMEEDVLTSPNRQPTKLAVVIDRSHRSHRALAWRITKISATRDKLVRARSVPWITLHA